MEIGDIIVTINDVNVLDFTHSDVVRLAHSGLLSLRLGLINTSKIIRRILNSTSSLTISGTSNEEKQTLTVTTTCESQTTSSITVSNGERTTSNSKTNEQTSTDSNQCTSDNEDDVND